MLILDKLNTRTWTEDDLGLIENAGDVGGDTQASDSVSRRFAQRIDGSDEFVVLDFYAYWAIDDINGDVNDENEPRGITISVCYAHCTDPNDPGNSETYADYRYWDHQERDDTPTPKARIEKLTREDLNEAVNQMGI